jgi:hypothetical protein
VAPSERPLQQVLGGNESGFRKPQVDSSPGQYLITLIKLFFECKLIEERLILYRFVILCRYECVAKPDLTQGFGFANPPS